MKDTCQCCYLIMDIQMPHFPNQLKTGSHNRSCVLLSVYVYSYSYLTCKICYQNTEILSQMLLKSIKNAHKRC